jgi:hypothetical protein
MRRPMVDADFQEIVETAVALIRGGTPGLFSTLILFPAFDDGESFESCHIGVLPAFCAPRGELLRIKDHFHDDRSDRLHCRDLLFLRLKPLLEACGQRLVCDEALECLVIFPAEPCEGSRLGHAA